MGEQLEGAAPVDPPDEPSATAVLAPAQEAEGKKVLTLALKTFHHFFGAFSPMATRRHRAAASP